MADGHGVVTAGNAAEAMARFADANFDLVITDHAMPGMNGLQFAEAVRELRAEHPVILVTGFAAGGLGRDECSAGVNLIMQKPVPRSDLRRALIAVMGR